MTKVVLLAGGLGTRLAEETELKPKPMVEIGDRPILWHVMRHYAEQGFKEFFVALGFRGEAVKRYFHDYHSLSGSMTIDLARGDLERHDKGPEDWIVHLHDTGLTTMTGGRLKRLEPFLADGTFMLTYGDGVSDINLRELLKFHKSHGRVGTVTAVRPPARFGGLVFDGDLVKEFTEKPQVGEGWINGGFMVFEPGIFGYLDKGDQTVLEADALERLAEEGQLAAYRHEAFWQCMDTLRDKRHLDRLWAQGDAPWKTWQ
ncbi:MAG: glucose-1-phosphate cytidylyltransferase [Acidobacteria bacterium]|nr:glucose-1-phosphate cytidylyltransferase [Acidobacteriota bacterium]